MTATCALRVSAIDVDGWGYVECELELGHRTTEGRGQGHRFGPIVHDGGAHRLANPPDERGEDVPREHTTRCPRCGCDVAGCTETIGNDGRRRWTQPVTTIDKGQQIGGLVHIEGGRRCLMDTSKAVSADG